MSRAVIRAIWGTHDRSSRTIARRFNVDRDAKYVKKNKYEVPFIVYGYGEENCKQMEDFGFNVYMIDKHYAPFDLVNHQYRHKLEIIKYAMEVDKYDEILFLDWDCRPFRNVPGDMWEIFHKKSIMQANLQQYNRRKCFWRSSDQRKLPNAGFLYIGDKSLPDKIIKAWEESPGNSAEPPIAKVMDDMSGGWKGMDYYWEHFEPELCNLHIRSVYADDKINQKDFCFVHRQGVITL